MTTRAVSRWLSALLAVFTSLTLGACVPSNHALHGLKRSRPLEVGGVTVREVSEQAAPAAFRFRAQAGGLLYVFFGYAQCPDICPTTLAEVRRTLRILGPESARVEVAFVTVDPARDSAAVLLPFLHAFVPAGRALLPASQDELATAERAFGATSSITRHADGTVDVSHTGAGYVVDSGGRVLVEWEYGTKPADMAADLRALLRLQRGTP